MNPPISLTVSLEEYKSLFALSDHSSIFQSPHFLSTLPSLSPIYCVISYKNVPVAGLVLLINKSKPSLIVEHDVVIYSGIFFSNMDNARPTKARLIQHQVLCFVAQHLADNFDSGSSLTFSPDIIDMRPFMWQKYNSDSSFNIQLNYTSILQLDSSLIDFNSSASLWSNMDPCRRNSVNNLRKKDTSYQISKNFDSFLPAYLSMMDRQSTDYDKDIMISHLDLLFKTHDLLHITLFDASSLPTYHVVYASHNNKSYYLYGVNTKYTAAHDGIYANWLAWRHLYLNNGISSIDLEGVNSPNRGSFKLSLGGSLQPYYTVTLE